MAQAKGRTRPVAERPLSPHIQIYSLLINTVMSGLHRLTGAALYLGSALLAWWLISASTGKAYFDFVNEIFGSPVGMLVLLGYTWALLHHMIGGIRHLIWDTGRGFKLSTVDAMSWATILLSLTATAAIWGLGLYLRGGL